MKRFPIAAYAAKLDPFARERFVRYAHAAPMEHLLRFLEADGLALDRGRMDFAQKSEAA